jgi:hypothetical protein
MKDDNSRLRLSTSRTRGVDNPGCIRSRFTHKALARLTKFHSVVKGTKLATLSR